MNLHLFLSFQAPGKPSPGKAGCKDLWFILITQGDLGIRGNTVTFQLDTVEVGACQHGLSVRYIQPFTWQLLPYLINGEERKLTSQ